MPILFIFILCYTLFSFSDTVKLRKSVANITHINGNNELVSHIYNNKYHNYLFVNNNGTRVKNNSNNKKKLYANSNSSIKKLMTIEKLKNDHGNEFLFTKFFINNKENKFVVDLCSSNSFIFEKNGNFEKNATNAYISSEKSDNDNNTHLSCSIEGTQNVKETLHLNDQNINAYKIINIKYDTKTIRFYLIKEEELSRNFDGIIGFDFFKNFDNFVLDTTNMNISLNENRNLDHKKDFYEIKLHNYNHNLMYFDVNVNKHLHKALIDTGSAKTIIANSDSIFKTNSEKENVVIESLLKNTYNVRKVDLNNFDLILRENKLVPINLKNVYKTNIEYLDKNVVLLGLDFLSNKKLYFDVANDTLYISNVFSNSSLEREISSSTYKDNAERRSMKRNDDKKMSDEQIDESKVEQYCQQIYEKLKTKELSFFKITNELEKENIYIKDCKNTNDVIKRYSIKLLYGPDYLKKNDKNENFHIRYNEMIEFFKKLNSEEKQNMLNTIISTIKKDKKTYEKASEIIEEYVNYEINNNVYSLHRFKSCNQNQNNEAALNDEYNSLYSYYTSHLDYSFEILNDFKKELSAKKINFSDCEDEKDLIKKIAHLRVYNNNTNSNKDAKNKSKNGNRNIIIRKYSNDDNNVHTQIIIRRNGLDSSADSPNGSDQDQSQYQYDGNLSKMDDLFPNSLFSGIFKNFFGDNRVESSEESNNQTDFFSDLNNLFGFGEIGDNIIKKKKKKSVLGFKTKEPEIKKENKKNTDTFSQAITEEKDVDIIYLLNKVEKLNDDNLKNFILQSLKNENIKKILVSAVKNGYNNTFERCKKQNDNKSMYLLQMLKQSGIF